LTQGGQGPIFNQNDPVNKKIANSQAFSDQLAVQLGNFVTAYDQGKEKTYLGPWAGNKYVAELRNLGDTPISEKKGGLEIVQNLLQNDMLYGALQQNISGRYNIQEILGHLGVLGKQATDPDVLLRITYAKYLLAKAQEHHLKYHTSATQNFEFGKRMEGEINRFVDAVKAKKSPGIPDNISPIIGGWKAVPPARQLNEPSTPAGALKTLQDLKNEKNGAVTRGVITAIPLPN
jgi:hypothetical protein